MFAQGISCGKHSFNDCHIVLMPEGACEARTIRRLAPEQAFNGPAMIPCRGLPWAYSPQGILVKHGGQAQKYRQPTLEAEIQPELETIAQTVAAGLVTPAPGLHGASQGIGDAAPTTPALLHLLRRGDMRRLRRETARGRIRQVTKEVSREERG